MASKIIVDQLQKTGGSTAALTLPTSNASASEFLPVSYTHLTLPTNREV